MPELPGPPLRPQLARHAGGARLLLDHIRRGRELVRRFEIGWDDEANDAYRAWQDRSRQLLRFLLMANELYEYLWAVYARMCLRHAPRVTDQREDLKTDLRELASAAQERGLRTGGLDSDPARAGAAPTFTASSTRRSTRRAPGGRSSAASSTRPASGSTR